MNSVSEEAARAHTRGIYDSSPVGIAIADLAGNLLEANPSYRKLVGASFDDIGPTALQQLLHMESAVGEVLLQELVEGRRDEFSIEKRWQRGDGSSCWLRATTSLVRTSEEAPEAIVVTVEDITERKNHQDVGDRLFELSADLIVVASLDGYFKRVSRSVSSVLGWSEEELLSRPWASFLHPDDTERVLGEVVRIMKTGDPTFDFDVRVMCADGSFRLLSASGSPDLEADLIYSVLVDVTDRRQIDADRRELDRSKQRERQALEINDTIVQGLAAAKMALEMDMDDKALDLIGGTLRTARSIVSTLLTSGSGLDLKPGDLRRGGAARIELVDDHRVKGRR